MSDKEKVKCLLKALRSARHLCSANAGEDKWTEEVLNEIDAAIAKATK